MAAGVGGGTHAVPSIMMCGQDKKVSEAARGRGGKQRTHHERRSAVQQNWRPQTNSAKEGDALARWGCKVPFADPQVPFHNICIGLRYYNHKCFCLQTEKCCGMLVCYTTVHSTLLQNTLLYCFTEQQPHDGTNANKRRHQQKDMV
jgi:hypothetical protein